MKNCSIQLSDVRNITEKMAQLNSPSQSKLINSEMIAGEKQTTSSSSADEYDVESELNVGTSHLNSEYKPLCTTYMKFHIKHCVQFYNIFI